MSPERFFDLKNLFSSFVVMSRRESHHPSGTGHLFFDFLRARPAGQRGVDLPEEAVEVEKVEETEEVEDVEKVRDFAPRDALLVGSGDEGTTIEANDSHDSLSPEGT